MWTPLSLKVSHAEALWTAVNINKAGGSFFFSVCLFAVYYQIGAYRHLLYGLCTYAIVFGHGSTLVMRKLTCFGEGSRESSCLGTVRNSRLPKAKTALTSVSTSQHK